jgi:hypothetical protein
MHLQLNVRTNSNHLSLLLYAQVVLTTYGTLSAELRAAESSKGSTNSSSATGTSCSSPFAGAKCTVAEALSHGDGSGARLPGILGVKWRRVS